MNLDKTKLFEEAQSLAQIGIWHQDVATRTHYWSDEMFRLLGLESSDHSHTGHEALKYIHPDDLGDVMWALECAEIHGISFDIEHRVITADGELKYIQSRCRCVTAVDGRVESLIGTLTDITVRKQAEEENFRLAAIVESSDEAISSISLDGMILSWNRAAELLYGYTASEIIGRHASVLSPVNKSFISESVAAILRGENLHNLEMIRKSKSGDEFDASLTMSAIRNRLGEVIAIAVMVRDITERKIAEAALRRSEMQLTEAQSIAKVGSWELHLDTKHITWSAEMFRIMGVDPMRGIPPIEKLRSTYHPDDLESYKEKLAESISTGCELDFDLRILDKDQHIRWCHILGHVVRDASGKSIRLVGALMDITERKEAEERLRDYTVALEFQKSELESANAQLETLATCDGLTGLTNHRAFQERLLAEFKLAHRYNVPLSLIMLDVDRFKLYNDTYGHPAGDMVLKTVASMLQKLSRKTDIVARYGGEEFVIVMPQTDSTGALISAERIRAHIENYAWNQREITVSIGVSCIQPAIRDQTDLITSADAALYRSKNGGRNRVTCAANVAAVPDRTALSSSVTH